MKSLSTTLIAVLVLSLAAPAFGAQAIPLSLGPPPMLIDELCKKPFWGGMNVVWQGVTDRRPEQAIGDQVQNNKETQSVIADPPLDGLFNASLKELFTGCGMKFVDKGSDALTLSAEIREFYVGVEKKLLTGKSEGHSTIVFSARRDGQSTSVTVGFEMDQKKIRSGKLKQLQATLNDLFAETLRQIVATSEMRELR